MLLEAPEAIMEECGLLWSVAHILRTRNDPNLFKETFEQFGCYWEYVFEYIAISKINVKPVWNKVRLVNNLKKLRETKKMPPIRLCFHEETGLYEIQDGIHRIAAAKQEGYCKVPAIVAYKRFTLP